MRRWPPTAATLAAAIVWAGSSSAPHHRGRLSRKSGMAAAHSRNARARHGVGSRLQDAGRRREKGGNGPHARDRGVESNVDRGERPRDERDEAENRFARPQRRVAMNEVAALVLGDLDFEERIGERQVDVVGERNCLTAGRRVPASCRGGAFSAMSERVESSEPRRGSSEASCISATVASSPSGDQSGSR